MKKQVSFISWALLAALLLAACGGPAATQAPAATAPPAAPTEPGAPTAEPSAPTAEPPAAGAPNILRVRLIHDSQTFDPAFGGGREIDVTSSIHQGLIEYQGTWDETVNVLAESLEVSEDGLSIAFTLREGVQFHGGYGELTAEDVKFSYERYLDPDLGALYAADWEALDNVEVTGRYTGIIHLREPNAALFVATLPSVSGWIVSQQAYQEHGPEGYALHPYGTGPYEFVEWVPNERTVVRRFADFWGPAPEWDEIHFLPLTEDSVAEVALEAGSVDFAEISTNAVGRFEGRPEFAVVEAETPHYYWLALNMQHPNLEDVNVRLAIRYGLNVPEILDGAFDGRWQRACSLIAPGVLGYWADAPCYERDVERAREYLAAAGHADGLALNYNVKNTERDRLAAEIIQAQLAEVGIDVTLIVQDAAVWGDEGYGPTGVEVRMLAGVYYSTLPDPSWSTIWFTCDYGPNDMHWCDPEFDALHTAALRELDPDRRAELYIQMQQMWDEAVHTVWIGHPVSYYVGRADLAPSVNPDGQLNAHLFRSR